MKMEKQIIAGFAWLAVGKIQCAAWGVERQVLDGARHARTRAYRIKPQPTSPAKNTVGIWPSSRETGSVSECVQPIVGPRDVLSCCPVLMVRRVWGLSSPEARSMAVQGTHCIIASYLAYGTKDSDTRRYQADQASYN